MKFDTTQSNLLRTWNLYRDKSVKCHLNGLIYFGHSKYSNMAEPMVKPKCIFCRIGQKIPLEGSVQATELLYEDETFAAFRDHRPAGEHHYLIIPKRHIRAFNCLQFEDTPLIQDMAEVAKKLLADRIGREVDDALVGFHWPFYTVGHLHLHAIWPPNRMSLFQKFEFSRLLFGSVSEALQTLEKRKKSS